MSLPPKIDPRSAKDVAARTRSLLTGWNSADPFGNALVQAFARLCEIVIERLNQVPERNFLAFLDMLGASRLPPQPARVPLAFTLAPGRLEDALVPAGTQAAAPPLEGEKEPAIYETERELWVAAVELESVFARDPRNDAHADYSALARDGLPAGAPLFLANAANEHVLYLGHDSLLDFPAIDEAFVDFSIAPLPAGTLDARSLRWEIWDGTQGVPIKPQSDDTSDLRAGGRVTFDFTGRAPVPRTEVGGRASRWLRLRLLTPVSSVEAARQGMVRASHLPRVSSVTLTVVVNRAGLAPSAAFASQGAVDLSKDWLPFGERPRIGDAFLLVQNEAFARPGARVTLKLAPTAGVTVRSAGNPQVRWEYWDGAAWRELMTCDVKGNLKRGGEAIEDKDFADTTGALTFPNREITLYDVKFRFDAPPQRLEVSGVAGYWIRTRLVAGDYGKEATYVEDTSTRPPGYRLEPATLAPPMIATLLVDYTLEASDAPEAIRTRNEFEARDIAVPLAAPFAPFEPPPGDRPELYLGFRLPKGRERFPNRTLSLYPMVERLRYGERRAPLHPAVSVASAPAGAVAVHRFVLSNPAPQPRTFLLRVLGGGWTAVAPGMITVQPGATAELAVNVAFPAGALSGTQDEAFLMLTAQEAAAEISVARLVTRVTGAAAPEAAATMSWQYWNGAAWKPLGVRDDTERFARPGTFSFLAPPDFAPSERFGVEPRRWLRVVWDRGEFQSFPFVRRLVPNTVMASQHVTITKEILGSSDGSEQQRFRTRRAPVLAEPELEVREPELPPLEEQKALHAVLGEGAINVVRDATGRPTEIWVRWQQVDDFYGSGPRDRHYVLDHVTGEVRFSDGANGLVPPRGRGNVRMRRYRTGGTARGNRAAGTVAQLKTTVPYIERVANPEPAAGGADAESLESLKDRVPREIRHRRRAVTQEDNEDLALRATAEVARAKCVPLRALDEDPLGSAPRLGHASVIIVPRSEQAKPLPSAELLARVRGYLGERADVTAGVSVVGPLYLRVDVAVEIVVADPDAARTVEQTVREKLRAFLHPLTGGLDGRGWDFGREPYRSDFHSLIHSIAGVDHIRSLQVEEIEELPGAKATGRYLVYSGEHRIGLSSSAD